MGEERLLTKSGRLGLPIDHSCVRLGEIIFTDDPEYYNLLGIGSCLGIFLYDLKRGLYMMGHTLLPTAVKKEPSRFISEDKVIIRYTDDAVNYMIDKMLKKGSSRQEMRVKIVGGAQIYVDSYYIGDKNYVMAKEIFNREQIQIVAEDVGGSKGRSILSFKKDGSVYMRKNSEKFFL